MPDPNQSLSEISHLFLSSVREKAANGTSERPKRVPPPKSPVHVSIDLTPEEFAQVFGAGEDPVAADPAGVDDAQRPAPVRGVTAVIASHLGAKQFDRIKDYARHLAADGTRVGVIEVCPSEFRVMCFDRHADDTDAPPEPPAECFDPRQMNEVLSEMSWDVQRWLLVLPQPRVPEARVLLRGVSRWTMLSTCDHDGVIACYRALKGLLDLWPGGKTEEKPSLSLALLDAADEEQAERVSAKLTSVCQQFLNWPLESEPHVAGSVGNVSDHLVMCCRPTREKGAVATAPQWEIVADFIARSKEATEEAEAPAAVAAEQSSAAPLADVSDRDRDAAGEQIYETQGKAVPMSNTIEDAPMMSTAAAATGPAATGPAAAAGAPITAAWATTISPTAAVAVESSDGATEVIDLPGHDLTEIGIVDAILRHCSGELVECPIAPPMCPKARLAVGRDRRIVMLAVSRQGLQDLNSIGQAYRWLQENQPLIAMAMPQLAIDPQQSPHLSLLVNQADSAAQTLQPMLQGNHVTVKTYRKLRWGGKTGLLLEAA